MGEGGSRGKYLLEANKLQAAVRWNNEKPKTFPPGQQVKWKLSPHQKGSKRVKTSQGGCKHIVWLRSEISKYQPEEHLSNNNQPLWGCWLVCLQCTEEEIIGSRILHPDSLFSDREPWPAASHFPDRGEEHQTVGSNCNRQENYLKKKRVFTILEGYDNYKYHSCHPVVRFRTTESEF